jgi:hypothetical protein
MQMQMQRAITPLPTSAVVRCALISGAYPCRVPGRMWISVRREATSGARRHQARGGVRREAASGEDWRVVADL